METMISELVKESDPEATTILCIVIAHKIFEKFGLGRIGEQKFSTLIYSLIYEFFEGGGKAEESLIRFIEIMRNTAEKQIEERKKGGMR